MRALFTDFYRRGRRFSTKDLLRLVSRIAGKLYDGFFSQYVSGTDVPPYETIFGFAGYQVDEPCESFPIWV
jgi:predicted metalloprotease with PDZ domain